LKVRSPTVTDALTRTVNDFGSKTNVFTAARPDESRYSKTTVCGARVASTTPSTLARPASVAPAVTANSPLRSCSLTPGLSTVTSNGLKVSSGR